MSKAKNNHLSSTIFSLNKRIVPSAGVFYGSSWNERNSTLEPLEILEKTVRGTMSHHIKETVASDPLKLQVEIEKPNIQLIDECALATDHDTLTVKFNVNFLPVIDGLEACNNPEYAKKYQQFIQNYTQAFNFKELASRYAHNLASGKFLWKNKVGALKSEIIITAQTTGDSATQEWVFDMNNVGSLEHPSHTLDGLIDTITQALNGNQPHALLSIKASVQRGNGQLVYPSQEFIQEKGNTESTKRKVLYSKGGIAGLHDQKIGNAIRTIDSWYPEFEQFGRVIAIEVYGTVTSLSTAFRNPSKTKSDYHSLMSKMTADKELSTNEMHYLMGMFVRGGVLGTEK